MELLAPAGGFEQLDAAIAYGADAVYLAADVFGMRARAANFAMSEIHEAVRRAHAAGVKVHVACNVLMFPDDMPALPEYFAQIDASGADALIIGDMGAFALARKYAPSCELHVSTQASVANAEAAKVWHSLGANRVVCAREMSLSDIEKLREDAPDDLEIETFVHGAQCMAESGRCLISSYLTGRSANKGHCTQPCRWSYTLEEEKRPGMHFPVEEDAAGRTFIMNAKDLNMAAHLHDLANAGVDSIKIEGRNKKAFYVATVVGAYRRVLDALCNSRGCDGEYTMLPEEFLADIDAELAAASHRPFSTGFYYGNPEQADGFDGYEQDSIHVADVVDCHPVSDGGAARYELLLRCRNRFAEGDSLEALVPMGSPEEFTVSGLRWLPSSAQEVDGLSPKKASELTGQAERGLSGEEAWVDVDVANRSCNIYAVDAERPVPAGSFVRARTYRRSARHG